MNANSSDYPWLGASSIAVTLNTRLPLKLNIQLEWLAKQGSMRKQAAVEAAVSAWVTQELRRRGVPE